MQGNQYNITYHDIDVLTQRIYDTLKKEKRIPKSVFGIPRGGVLPAYILAQKFNAKFVENPNEGLIHNAPVLIVDDILDSGRTMNKYRGTDGVIRAVLLSKRKDLIDCLVAEHIEPGVWVNFPWEMNDGEEEGIEDNIVRILQYIGEDADREGLLETPARVQRAYGELFAGYKQDPHKILSKRFTSEYDQMVVLRNIEFTSTCEHHMLPFFGSVSIAYVPDGKVVGISKLARLVDCFSRRLQIQEQMTEQIANAIFQELGALGVGVVIKSRHMCMMIRGVEKQQSEMITSKVLGALMDKPAAREEFLNLIK